jgi:membrane protein YdbS with pleckstrin-like domain
VRSPFIPMRDRGTPAVITDYLLPHEREVLTVHRHPAIFVVPISVLVACCVIAGVLTAFVLAGNAVGLGLVWAACFAVLLYLLAQAAAWRRSYFVVTKARIILIGGLVTHTVTTLPVAKITDVTLLRSKPGRLFGYGKITADMAGATAIPINYMPYPEQIFEEVRAVLQLGDYAEDERESEPG